MNDLKVTNPNGSTYTFAVINYDLVIEAIGKSGKPFLFKVESGEIIEREMLKTKCGKKLPCYENAEKIQAFIDNANTRKLASFDTHEEMMDVIRSTDQSIGKPFRSNDKHCFYVYNK